MRPKSFIQTEVQPEAIFNVTLELRALQALSDVLQGQGGAPANTVLSTEEKLKTFFCYCEHKLLTMQDVYS